jgi:hypothetical protein
MARVCLRRIKGIMFIECCLLRVQMKLEIHGDFGRNEKISLIYSKSKSDLQR